MGKQNLHDKNADCLIVGVFSRIYRSKRMSEFVISNEEEWENALLRETSKENIARVSENMWSIRDNLSVTQFQKLIELGQDFDMVYMDVTRKNAIEVTEQMRKENKQTVLMIIADENLSPMEYLKPSVQAASLLLRPFEEEQAKEVVKKTWDWYGEKVSSEDEFLSLEIDHDKVIIPYGRILYFESNNKKIYVNLQHEKYCISDTLERLEKYLPDYFIRSHRSYIVNKRKIKNIFLSKGEIVLEHEVFVPVSRSYKPIIKELKGYYETKHCI